MFIVLSFTEISVSRVHSDHNTVTQCMAAGGRRLDGDNLGHIHFITQPEGWYSFRHPAEGSG